jgi:hypothetical protein
MCCWSVSVTGVLGERRGIAGLTCLSVSALSWAGALVAAPAEEKWYHRSAVVQRHAGIRLHEKGSCMYPFPETTFTSDTRFHCRAGGFPLHCCTYVLLDANGNDTADRKQLAVLRVTAMTGERFRLRDPSDIQRFFAAVGRLTDEVAS